MTSGRVLKGPEGLQRVRRGLGMSIQEGLEGSWSILGVLEDQEGLKGYKMIKVGSGGSGKIRTATRKFLRVEDGQVRLRMVQDFLEGL